MSVLQRRKRFEVKIEARGRLGVPVGHETTIHFVQLLLMCLTDTRLPGSL